MHNKTSTVGGPTCRPPYQPFPAFVVFETNRKRPLLTTWDLNEVWVGGKPPPSMYEASKQALDYTSSWSG